MTYLSLAVVVLLAAGLFALVVHRRRGPWARVAVLALVLVALTAVFDNVMIAADLFGYAAEHTAGVWIGLAPIEDFAWPLVAALLVPALWVVTGRVAGARSRREATEDGR
ncbi:lycopene cyclase domain-containing protein [Ruania halotolerans]|uniref:lycopene cyclase domain-containing protein n=1 Tax=Ruania halotolerans TaxID=2897773 RepID=UPI001E3B8309|nr:lycopene cyclase domain-containing protein [Ruania halotolerans]UFU06875.1 lycopene cyclase domain-containing protein [Ruania halotolerans]